MKKRKTANLLIIFIISFLIIACSPQDKDWEELQEESETFVDTGILVVESTPSGADVYASDLYLGKTPLTQYNFPVGAYKVVVKKDGYTDFEKLVSIKVGATEELDVKLNPVQKPQQQPKQEQPQGTKQEEQTEQKPVLSNKINLSSFAMYHDFENKMFTELRSGNSDVFSRRYDTYVDFVALAPGKIEIINKPLKELTKTDCINTDGGVVQLHSGETICVVTIEGNFFALSGSWEKMPTELEFVELS